MPAKLTNMALKILTRLLSIRDRSQGGGGFRGGYSFQNHLKEGGKFYSEFLEGYIFLRLVFLCCGVTDVSFCSASNITQKMA